MGKHLKKEIKATLPSSETFFFYSLDLCLMVWGFLTVDVFSLVDNLLIPSLFNEKAKFCFHLFIQWNATDGQLTGTSHPTQAPW